MAIRPLYLCLFFAVLYLLTPTADYFWDGITFALQIEKVANNERGFSLLFHQSHLLYNVFGYFVYKVAHAINWQVRALDLLQVINSLIGAAGVTVLFVIARRLTGNPYASTICALFLGVSVTWWKLATDCDAYILSTTLLLFCLLTLTSSKPRWYIAAFLLALAMLIHELASLFTFAAVAFVWLNDGIQRKRTFALLMTALAWTIAVGSYYFVAATMFGLRHPFEVIKWATTNPSLITPERNPLPGLLITPRTHIDLLFGHSFTLFRQQGRWLVWTFFIAALVFILLFLIKSLPGNRLLRFVKSLRPSASAEPQGHIKLLVLCLLVWVTPYLILLAFFEPQDPYLRLFYAPAIALAIGIALARFHASEARISSVATSSLPSVAAMFAILAFACLNLAFFILIFMRADSNPLIVKAKQATTVWNDRTVVFFAKRNEADTTFEYFNTTSKWRRLGPELTNRLPDEIHQILQQGGNVWLNKGALATIGEATLADFEKGKEILVERSFSPAHYIQLLAKSETAP